MSRTWTKGPRDSWPNPAAGDTIVLLRGTHRAHVFPRLPGLTIQGKEGSRIVGSIVPSGEPPCSLRFQDGCDDLTILGPLVVESSEGRGIRITRAENVRILGNGPLGIKSRRHRIEAIILGDCPRATLEEIECSESRDPGRGYDLDQLHGIYLSGQADGSTVRRCSLHDLTGSGVQLNGHGMGAVIQGATLEELDFARCGTNSTPPVSFMAVRNAEMRRFRVMEARAGWWIVLFDDYGGEEFACYDNTFQDYTADGEVHEEAGSARNTFLPGNGWAPGTELPPGPEEPTPPEEPVLPADLDLAYVRQQLVAIGEAQRLALAMLDRHLGGGR